MADGYGWIDGLRRFGVINLNDEMRQLIDRNRADGLSCLLGAASADGRPQISIKGSVLVFDRETLAYWERAKRSALDNIVQNPQVVIFYRNPEQRVNRRFHGTATVYETGAIRANVMSRTVKDEIDGTRSARAWRCWCGWTASPS
jgi:hypothetical protein